MLRLIIIPILLAALTSILTAQLALWRSRKELSSNSRPLHHPAITAQAARLATALEIDQIPVLELKMEAVNGMADADGRVFLTSGFVKKLDQGLITAEEMASVIAHELGHVAQGHVKARMRQVMGHQTALMVGGILLARILPFIGPWIAAQVSGALAARASRTAEFEADAWASALLIKSGIGTAPQKSLFEKLDQLTNQAGAAIPEWLRSHPTSPQRIAAIEENERRWQMPRR